MASGYIDPSKLTSPTEKEDIAASLGISTSEVSAAGRLLFIFGHPAVRREPVTSTQLSKIYVDSKFNRSEFGKNKSNDGNATIRRLLGSWAKTARTNESLVRTLECHATGCTVQTPHRLCCRRDTSWNVYYMREHVWDSLYGNSKASWSELTTLLFKRVVVNDPNLLFDDADNDMITTNDDVMESIVSTEEPLQEQEPDLFVQQPSFSFPSEVVYDHVAPMELTYGEKMDQIDELWEQLFPTRIIKHSDEFFAGPSIF